MWRSRIFWRLFGVYSLLLALSIGLLGWLLLRRMESQVLEEIRHGLETKTVLVAGLVTDSTVGGKERQQRVTQLGKEIQSQITLIAADGQVLADSAENPADMDNHLDRPEVQQARTHATGWATRHSEIVGETTMYVARQMESGPVRYVRVAVSLGGVEQELAWQRRIAWTAAGLTLLLALIVSVVLARRLTAPLVELAEVAHATGKGACGRRVPVTSNDEIGVLAAAFNDMSQACADHIAQMEHDRQQLRAVFRSMVEGVVVLDGEQRIQFLNEAASRLLNLPLESSPGRQFWQLVRHRQLAEAINRVLANNEPHRCDVEWNTPPGRVLTMHGARLPGDPVPGAVLVFHDITHLRQLERVRQDFVANVSHELKTPLAAIQATVETLLDGAIRDPDYNVGFLQRLRENAERLSRLVQDLLTLGRIESGQEVMERERIPLHGAVEACVSRQEDRALGKGLRLEQHPPAEPVTVLADEEALAHILDNLVDNAIKYTPADGRVALRWFSENGEAVLQVEDTGVGIPEKDLARIFERFYRVDKARSRALGGTGLGLTIVKHLAQGLGGSVRATSQLGAGSTFTVHLPLANAAAGQE